jgi:hypothetical protein
MATMADPIQPFASSSSSRNPLTHRVSSLLSSDLHDKQTHAALDTLSAFDLASTSSRASSSGLRREVERRMQQSTRAFLEAFAEVDEVSPGNLRLSKEFGLSEVSGLRYLITMHPLGI